MNPDFFSLKHVALRKKLVKEEFPKALTLFSVVHIDLLKNTAFNKRPYSPEMYSNSKQVGQTANVWDFVLFSHKLHSCFSVKNPLLEVDVEVT